MFATYDSQVLFQFTWLLTEIFTYIITVPEPSLHIPNCQGYSKETDLTYSM